MAPKPNLEVLAVEPGQRDPGLVVLTLGYNTRSVNKTSARELIIAIDQHGRIAWQHEVTHALMDCRPTSSGTLFVMLADGRIQELAPDGALLSEWYSEGVHPDGVPANADAIGLPTLKLHHSMYELADGKIAALSVALLEGVSDDPKWPDTMEDTIIVFDRDGTVETEIHLGSLLDLDRRSLSHFIPYWPLQGFHGVTDWSHANCISTDPADGGFIVSLRHQDAVIKVSRSGELIWILSAADWASAWSDKVLRTEGGRPFFHQHDAGFTPDGELLLFDNGTQGARPPAEAQPLDEQQSFALSYRIDEAAMAATEVWRYGGDEIEFSTYVGGVTEMPNGNRFIACTGIKSTPDGERAPLPPQGIGSVQLYEVTPAGEQVFRAQILDPVAGPDEGWNGFRPQYLPEGFLT